MAILSNDYTESTLRAKDLGAEALELDLLATGLENYREDKKRFSIVVAHEITHILVYRYFANSNPRLFGWSRPWDEGLAQDIEYRFELAKDKKLHPAGCIKARPGDLLLTGDDALWVFEQEKLVAIKKGYELGEKDQIRWADCVYPLGRQFIEFIRVHLNGEGCPDTILKIGNVVMKTAQSHGMFDEEFKKEFGVNLSEIQRQFIEHLHATQNNPAMRFEGTIIEP